MEKYLHKCLDSLIVSDEKMPLLEVLVVNDGSKDSSSRIAHEYEVKYPQSFRVIDKENGNYGSCINRGLKEATGRFIKVLDADDYFENEVLCNYMEFLEQCDSDLVVSDFDIVNESGHCLSEFTFNLPTEKQFFLKNIPNAMNILLWHQAITYKKVVFNNLDYKQTERISYTDDEWIFKPMFAVTGIVYFPQLLYHYLRGREGQTFDSKVIQKSLSQRVAVVKEMVGYYEKNIKRCLPDNVAFVTEKLARRIQVVYDYHIIVFPTNENNHQLIAFDKYLEQISPSIHNHLNDLANNYGWHYIRQWRKMDHSLYAPEIAIIRIKRKLWKLFKGEKWNVGTVPSRLKRPNY